MKNMYSTFLIRVVVLCPKYLQVSIYPDVCSASVVGYGTFVWFTASGRLNVVSVILIES